MNNTYIPNILKDKLSIFINYFYGCIHFVIFIFLVISLFSFDINDNSFLTKSSQSISNFGGEVGSHVSSFIFYTFGLSGYAFIIFFLIVSVLTFIKRRPKHFFIRLLLFFISLILLPQTFLQINLNINFIEQIEDWGIISKNLYSLHQVNYVSHSLSFIGAILFIACLNIHQLLKIPSFKIQNFNRTKKKIISNN